MQILFLQFLFAIYFQLLIGWHLNNKRKTTRKYYTNEHLFFISRFIKFKYREREVNIRMTSIQCILINPVTDELVTTTLHEFKYEDYTSYQREIDGSFAAMTLYDTLPTGEELEYVLIYDDEGKLKDEKNVSLILLDETDILNYIVGKVLVVKGQGEDLVSLEPHELEHLLHKLSKRITFGVRYDGKVVQYPYIYF